MDVISKLKRYCCLGSFEPVYRHLRGDPDVGELLPQIESMVKTISDVDFIILITELITKTKLVRKDESIFVYATYLASSVDDKWKTGVRKIFPALLATDDELFMFCKYADLIAKLKNHKGFSKTVRKAITAWYGFRPHETIREMWTEHRGLHGFTHKDLFKLCRIPDRILDCPPETVKSFFKTCSQITKEYEAAVEAAKLQAEQQPSSSSKAIEDKSDKMEVEQEKSLTTKSAKKAAKRRAKKLAAKLKAKEEKAAAKKMKVQQKKAAANKPDDKMEVQQQKKSSEPKNGKPAPTNMLAAIAALRNTKVKIDAIRIIRRYKLRYNQVPGHLLRFQIIMDAVLPTMPYLQILRFWRKMGRYHHFRNPKFFAQCRKILENKELYKRNHLHPVHILMNVRKAASTVNTQKLPAKKLEDLKLEYLEKLFNNTFQWNQGSGNWRMCITVNLQKSYKKKMLKTQKNLSYYDACRALSFGYFKREAVVDIFYWGEDKTSVKPLELEKNCSTEVGFSKFDVVEIEKNSQRLVNPLIAASEKNVIYDVFLCIVPTAGRSNPKQNSDYLCKKLDSYRENCNPKARFIILDLLKHKRSMTYSTQRCENILEICGLDEHTTDIIYNFATHRFD